MEYYCLMVRAGKEAEYRRLAQQALDQHGASTRLYFFRRKLKKGNGSFFGVPLFLQERRSKAGSGPLVGLEGSVYKVNKKKRRITVVSSLSLDGKKFGLLYEEAEPLEGTGDGI